MVNDEMKKLFECDDCGDYTPKMFYVDNSEWLAVVGTENRKLYLCQRCYDLRRIEKDIAAGPREVVA